MNVESDNLVFYATMLVLFVINFWFFKRAKDAFHERVKCYQHWQHSQMMLKKKRELKERMEAAGRTDKLDIASQEVIEVSEMTADLCPEFTESNRSMCVAAGGQSFTVRRGIPESVESN